MTISARTSLQSKPLEAALVTERLNPAIALSLPPIVPREARMVAFPAPDGEKEPRKQDEKTDIGAVIKERFKAETTKYEKSTGSDFYRDLSNYAVEVKKRPLISDERAAEMKKVLSASWGISPATKMRIYADESGSAFVKGHIKGEIDLGTKASPTAYFEFTPADGTFTLSGPTLLAKQRFVAADPKALIASAKLSGELGAEMHGEKFSAWNDLGVEEKDKILRKLDEVLGLEKGTVKEIKGYKNERGILVFDMCDETGPVASFKKTTDPKTSDQELTLTFSPKKK